MNNNDDDMNNNYNYNNDKNNPTKNPKSIQKFKQVYMFLIKKSRNEKMVEDVVRWPLPLYPFVSFNALAINVSQ